MGMMSEFKQFALKGNVMDLAVGVIIGGAFGKIVSSLVDNVIMPIIGLVLGDVNRFSELTIGGIRIGLFIQAIIDFLLIAFILFLMVKGVNRLRAKEEAAPPPPPEPSSTDKLLIEIRDLLKKQ